LLNVYETMHTASGLDPKGTERRLDTSRSKQDPVAGSCEHNSKLSVYKEAGNF